MDPVKKRMKAKPKSQEMPADLVIGLNDPGMTPLLRAGLGGLAASLRARLLEESPKAKWPSPVSLGKGIATIEPNRVVLSWNGSDPEKVLKDLFNGAFRLTKREGLIDLPGTYEPSRPLALDARVALQAALKRTFLQHGKTTEKKGSAIVRQVDIDDRTHQLTAQPYESFVHQRAWEDVAGALKKSAIELAGWAYPGAAQRHVAHGSSKMQYPAGHALCGCFSMVGCLSFAADPGSAGALVIPEPSNLINFALIRPRLTPDRLTAFHVSGVADAVLNIHLALRLDDLAKERPGVRTAHGVLMGVVAWASQQKTRVHTLTVDAVSPDQLDLFHRVTHTLPARVVPLERKKNREEDFFIAPSALRGFVTHNLARGQPWHRGFAVTKTGGSDARFIHQFRDAHNRGALRFEEKKGLIQMLSHLEEHEAALVRSVHLALRNRFGAIAEESKDNRATMRNRFSGERERWRLAFFGAKTHEQVRAALADLWSRAGSNAELQKNWERVLPLLRSTNWQTARDLALVALASYGSAEDPVNSDN